MPALQRAAPKARVENAAGVWTRIPPPTLNQNGAVYDPLRQRLLVFGGSDNDTVTNDLWELKLTGTPTWTRLQTTGSRPAARQAHGLLYDPRRDRLLLFGGADGSNQTLNDIWELPLAVAPLAWIQSLPLGLQPDPRAYASAIYDSTGDRVILFGGALAVSDTGPPTNFLNDVWALPLDVAPAWTQLLPLGTPPSGRAGPQVIYDAGRGRMIVYGGFDGTLLGDAFSLSLDASPQWTALAPTGGPPSPRAVAATIYDPPNDRLVLYGGIGGNGDSTLTDVWSLALASPAWTEITPTGGPPSPRDFPTTVYDLQRRQMVIYAGRDTAQRTLGDVAWGLNLEGLPQWTLLTDGPLGRYQSAGIYDPTRNRMLIYGGFDGTNWLGDTWSLTLDFDPRWSQLTFSGSTPGPRTGHSAIYDLGRDRLVLFGGNFAMTGYNDVWTLSLGATPAWTQIIPSGTPPSPRSTHSAFYDRRRDRMIVYGGNTGSQVGETWALDLSANVWTELDDGTLGPSPSAFPAVAFDERNNQILVFSGLGQTDDVWVLSLSGTPTWNQIAVPGPRPAARYGAVAAYDTLKEAMLLSGGNGNTSGSLNDSWALVLSGGPVWIPIDVGSDIPTGRTESVGVYDQASGRLVLFGGTEFGFALRSDTWVLAVDRATPVLASLVSSTARPDRVDLVWQLAQSAAGVQIERRERDEAWQPIATRDADGSGRLVFADANVTPGHRYGYRLGIPDGAGVTMTPEEWVDVPFAPRLELAGFVPNPTVSGASVTFSLPNAGPARVEVLDVGGRRVFAREVGSLGPGKHSVSLRGSRMPAGLYIIRLESGGRVVQRRSVLLR
ncbi:MAG TPA: kelch repeat-containing protein [Gemmatimonadales bacterium]|nr:kelch repeat-containing protein [Gemmatimonadales bacterium]